MKKIIKYVGMFLIALPIVTLSISQGRGFRHTWMKIANDMFNELLKIKE